LIEAGFVAALASAALASAALAAVAAGTGEPLSLLRWTAPGAETAAMNSQPFTCLSFDASLAAEVAAGQALFNSPALLGGQAAKAGLSCAACHVNGRDNPHFLMAGISDQAGTADVTSSFFSSARGNSRFDPVTIPDLAAPGKISRRAESGALAAFIRMLIVEEFAGAEPSAAMLNALAHYVRAIRPCPAETPVMQARTLDDQLQLIDAALTGARAMAADDAGRRDAQAVAAMIAAARHQLGLIAERYPGDRLAGQRAALLGASRALQAIGEQQRSASELAAAISKWQRDFARDTVPKLRRSQKQSLYDATR
jgi:hypothetical protein